VDALTVRENSMMSTADNSPQILTQSAGLTGNPCTPGIVRLYITAPGRYTAFWLIAVLAHKLNLSRFW
jgi:hypothetical protein